METEIKSIPNLSKIEFDRVLKMVTTTVVEVIVKNESRILLEERNTEPFRGMRHLPGGFVHYNEKISILSPYQKRIFNDAMKNS